MGNALSKARDVVVGKPESHTNDDADLVGTAMRSRRFLSEKISAMLRVALSATLGAMKNRGPPDSRSEIKPLDNDESQLIWMTSKAPQDLLTAYKVWIN